MVSNGFETDGFIEQVLPAGKYKVKVVGTDFIVIAVKSGRMKKNKITLIEGDRIRMDINEYDNTKGRITFRYKNRSGNEVIPWEDKKD